MISKKMCAIGIFFGLACISSASGEEVYCKEVTPTRFNDIWGKHIASNFQINYDADDDEFYLYSAEGLTTFGFGLSRAQADSLIQRIEKFKSWNLKASEKGVKLEKDIGTVEAKMTGWRMGDEWSFGPSADIRVVFFSQTENVHQMVLAFPKVTARSNQFDTHSAEALYFDWNNAKRLGEVLAAAAVEEWLAELRNQKAIEDEFK